MLWVDPAARRQAEPDTARQRAVASPLHSGHVRCVSAGGRTVPLSYRGSRSLPLYPNSRLACSKVALLRLSPATIWPGRALPELGGGRAGPEKWRSRARRPHKLPQGCRTRVSVFELVPGYLTSPLT